MTEQLWLEFFALIESAVFTGGDAAVGGVATASAILAAEGSEARQRFVRFLDGKPELAQTVSSCLAAGPAPALPPGWIPAPEGITLGPLRKQR